MRDHRVGRRSGSRAERRAERQAERQDGRWIEREAGSGAELETGRETGRQSGRQTERRDERRDEQQARRRFKSRKIRWKYRFRRLAVFLVVLPVLLLFLYMFVPWTQRVVLLGSDQRTTEASRSDTIMIAAEGDASGVLSVPRDSRVKIPGHGKDKINSAYAYGGPDLTVTTLEDFTGLHINNYIVIKFHAVEDIVNALGGVTIDVKEPIDLGIEGRVFKIKPGRQVLSGGQALAYVRWRGDPKADIGRIGRQQQFMATLRHEVLSPGNWTKLPAVIQAVLKNTDTNMNTLEVARFMMWMEISGKSEVKTYPGVGKYIDGVSYWIPDKKAGDKMIEETMK